MMTSDAQSSEAPFFVVGAPRSGTTLLRLMLHAHARLCVPPESHFIPALYRDIGPTFDCDAALRTLLSHPRFLEWDLDETRVADAVRSSNVESWQQFFNTVYGVYTSHDNAQRWGDKTPVYACDLHILHAIFSDAFIIHIIRDARDVVCSLRSMPWFKGNLIDAADRWNATVNAARDDGTKLFGERFMEIRYESLIQDPRGQLIELCDGLGESFDEAMLEPQKNAATAIPEARRAWHERTSEQVSRAAEGRWKKELTVKERAVIQQICGTTMLRYGYELESDLPRSTFTISKHRLRQRFGAETPAIRYGSRPLPAGDSLS